MSEQFIDFFMTITPTILTSVTGFLLGKYNYFQNRPLDKMEIAYDRVYYPIERIIGEKSIKISTVIDRTKIYFLKYEKYIDKSTLMVYKQLCKCKDEEEQQSIYDSFRTLMSRIDNKTNELLRGLSDELNSIFDGVEMNDMKCWGTAS